MCEKSLNIHFLFLINDLILFLVLIKKFIIVIDEFKILFLVSIFV